MVFGQNLNILISAKQHNCISLERAREEEQNDANFSFLAPSSEELWVIITNPPFLLQVYIIMSCLLFVCSLSVAVSSSPELCSTLRCLETHQRTARQRWRQSCCAVPRSKHSTCHSRSWQSCGTFSDKAFHRRRSKNINHHDVWIQITCIT